MLAGSRHKLTVDYGHGNTSITSRSAAINCASLHQPLITLKHFPSKWLQSFAGWKLFRSLIFRYFWSSIIPQALFFGDQSGSAGKNRKKLTDESGSGATQLAYQLASDIKVPQQQFHWWRTCRTCWTQPNAPFLPTLKIWSASKFCSDVSTV